jgi:hypothetical protein
MRAVASLIFRSSPLRPPASLHQPLAAASPAPPICRPHSEKPECFKGGLYLRKFALVPLTSAVVLFVSLAHAQQLDVAVGAGILLSTKNTNATANYIPPPEKGGLYPSFSFTRIFKNRYGYNGEVATVYKYQLYNGYQQYRPILYDLNAVYAPQVAKRITAELMGGIGGQRVLFYNQYATCSFGGGCATALNSNHFLLHLGAGVRYTAWRHFFVRPEAHLYRIVNNSQFHSDNVLRVGVSVGYTFGHE